MLGNPRMVMGKFYEKALDQTTAGFRSWEIPMERHFSGHLLRKVGCVCVFFPEAAVEKIAENRAAGKYRHGEWPLCSWNHCKEKKTTTVPSFEKVTKTLNTLKNI